MKSIVPDRLLEYSDCRGRQGSRVEDHGEGEEGAVDEGIAG